MMYLKNKTVNPPQLEMTTIIDTPESIAVSLAMESPDVPYLTYGEYLITW